MGHGHPLKCEGMIFPPPKGKMIDGGTKSSLQVAFKVLNFILYHIIHKHTMNILAFDLF